MSGAYYVYEHRDPVTRECVYVGSGTDSRAWQYVAHKERKGGGRKRNTRHAAWMAGLILANHTPLDWVHVVTHGLSKEAARKIERILIEEHQPTFNKRVPAEVPTLGLIADPRQLELAL